MNNLSTKLTKEINKGKGMKERNKQKVIKKGKS